VATSDPSVERTCPPPLASAKPPLMSNVRPRESPHRYGKGILGYVVQGSLRCGGSCSACRAQSRSLWRQVPCQRYVCCRARRRGQADVHKRASPTCGRPSWQTLAATMPVVLRSIALLIAVSAYSGPAMAQGNSAEVRDVARDIIAKPEWIREAEFCPATVMASKEATDYLSVNDCKPGKLFACFAKCSAGSGGACYWLAYALQLENAPPDSYESLYQRSCKLGVMSGCTNRAAGMLRGRPDDERTKACAAQTFEAVCAFDDPWACTMIALHLSRGIGVEQDTARALKSLEKSCKYGPEDEACIYAAHVRRDIRAREQGK